ncbi:MAG: chorismate synthase [Candidatus Omnitrophica bacterium]|nr:chorismate synthase [Candidatus Omnitrophota bacterium]
MRYITAGESHGKALMAILEGMPSGLKINTDFINHELWRRQQGVGRGKRMKIEKDTIHVLSGIRKGITIASPIGLLIENKDSSIEKLPDIVCPRPGHADLAGVLKYNFTDARNVLERASARETAIHVAVGAVCKMFLAEFDISVSSRVISIGGADNEEAMVDAVAGAQAEHDTLGGIFEIIVSGIIPGLGSYTQEDRRLDGRLSHAIMAIPGIKAVEIGLGFGYADKRGSQCHDAIYFKKEKGFYRKTNNAGGIEGGMSNGEDIIVRACMKPISTLLKPLDSVNIITKKQAKATVERSDVAAVESAGVVAEAVTAYVIADAFTDKFGNDCLSDIKSFFKSYVKRLA